MKRSSICIFSLLAVAATGAFAAETPPTAEQAKQDVNAQKQDPLGIQTSSPEDWNTLKGHDKGYVMKDDALPNSWLAMNFKSCDRDQDGKVSQSEYDTCRKAEKR